MRVLERTSSGDLDALILDVDREAETRKRRGLICAVCANVITYEIYQSTVSGSHRMRRVNPHGIEYEFAIFSEAPGCTDVGVATEKNTWFKGFAWRIALCGRCAEHLGWHFTSRDRDSFYGLIADKVVPDADERGSSE